MAFLQPKGSVIGILKDGKTIQEKFDLFSSNTGTSLIGWGQTDLSVLINQCANIQSYMSASEIADVNSSAPSVDCTSALVQAAATGLPVYIPSVKGYYIVGDAEIPDHTTIFGSNTLTYTIANDAAIMGTGSVIKIKTGATSILKPQRYLNLYSINFWGGDKTKDLLAKRIPANDIQRVRIDKCGIHGFRVGVGLNTGYCKEFDVTDCRISGNLDGIKNLVDSKIIGGYINANSGRGIAQLTGANDLIVLGVKIEWNDAQNIFCYQVKNITITGCILDRSGLQGISCQESEVTVSGGKVRRSGRLAKGTNQCAHFYQEGASAKLIVTGTDTHNGADDNGSGDNTPDYSIIAGGGSTDMTLIFSGCSLVGSVVDVLKFVVTPSRAKITGCIGPNDYSNYGLSRASNGKRFTSNGNVTVTGTTPGVISLSNGVSGDFSRNLKRIEITARDTNVNNSNASCFVDILVSKDGGAPSIIVNQLTSFPSDAFGTAAGANRVVSFENIAADGSSFDMRIVAATGTANIRYDAFLI